MQRFPPVLSKNCPEPGLKIETLAWKLIHYCRGKIAAQRPQGVNRNFPQCASCLHPAPTLDNARFRTLKHKGRLHFGENDVISPEFDENGRPCAVFRALFVAVGDGQRARARAGKLLAGDGCRVQRSAGRFPPRCCREAPVTLSWFGMGASSWRWRKRARSSGFGIEVHSPGVGACLAPSGSQLGALKTCASYAPRTR